MSNSQENSVLHILKRKEKARKGDFIIDHYLSVLIPESYTSVRSISILDVNWCATRKGGGGFPCPLLKIGKSALILDKKVPG